MNPNLTMEYVEQHPEKQWDWLEISYIKFIHDKEAVMIQQYKKPSAFNSTGSKQN